MKIRAFRFYFREASRNVFRNGWMGVASVFTIFFCLVMFGACVAIGANVNYNIEIVESQYDIPVSVNGDIPESLVYSMADEFALIEGVSEVTVVTKTEGLELVKEDLEGYEGLAAGLDEANPLPHVIKVNLTELEYADAVIEKINTYSGIEGINTRFELRTKLAQIASGVSKVTFYIMLFLMFIAVFIIANTIRISVFARRKEINIMKFVGGTDWFIRWPFIIEGMIIGLVGCLLAFGAVTGLYLYVESKMATAGLGVFSVMSYANLWLYILVSFAGLSILLGSVGSYISTRKHLRV